MSSEDEDIEMSEPEKAAKADCTQGIPPASKHKYDKVYDDFQKWNKVEGATLLSENVLMKYFLELDAKSKPPTLWANYSMLKATLRANDNIDISAYAELLKFLKTKSSGYKPAKPTVFTEEQIEKFINEAPDEQWLHLKVVCIFGVKGVFSSNKLVSITIDQIKMYDDLILVTMPKTETTPKRTFTITGKFFNIVQKYIALRPPNTTTNRLFLNYNEDKCTSQPIGRNKFYDIPRRIAKYLKLTKPERYTGPSFRISSIPAAMQTKPWNLDSVTAAHDNQYSLDYETGLLKTSSIANTIMPVFASSNTNDNWNSNKTGSSTGTESEHVCTLSCGQVKCASEENEEDALHAFTIMKPSEYNIEDVTPALFTSEPFCRWIVAYTHVTEPVSTFNADETFKTITRSTPNNVIVVQKYIRSNSSQLLKAYMVVYGVNCTCHNPNLQYLVFQ